MDGYAKKSQYNPQPKNLNKMDTEEKNKIMLEALQDISKGEGRYDMDKLKHASNTIEDMKKLAFEAIEKVTK